MRKWNGVWFDVVIAAVVFTLLTITFGAKAQEVRLGSLDTVTSGRDGGFMNSEGEVYVQNGSRDVLFDIASQTELDQSVENTNNSILNLDNRINNLEFIDSSSLDSLGDLVIGLDSALKRQDDIQNADRAVQGALASMMSDSNLSIGLGTANGETALAGRVRLYDSDSTGCCGRISIGAAGTINSQDKYSAGVSFNLRNNWPWSN